MQFLFKRKVKLFLSFFCLLMVNNLYSQYLVDYLVEAEKNFKPNLNESLQVINYPTTNLSFGYFVNEQQTVSGAQSAYVQLQQQLPWLGKGASYKKYSKYLKELNESKSKSQLAQLRFLVKQAYYNMYRYNKQKNVCLVYASKLRDFITGFKTDSVSIDFLLKKLKLEEELVEVTKKQQLTDGEFQKQELEFRKLINSENISEINLPSELAMPDEDGSISFSETYENPFFLEYENGLLARQQVQKFNNKWSPSISLGFRYTQVNNSDNIIEQLPTQNILEPQIHLSWNLFSKNKGHTSVEEIENMIDQKVVSISTDLQILMNDQISARIAYYASIEKQEQLKKMQEQLKQKNVSLTTEQELEVAKLTAAYELEKIEAVTNYYVSSSKMLLYQ